ncbi:MAG TPA: ribosome-associated translation inhibitor RaiA [Candidatus Hydrogenedentes bacterium]|nr:ribosome-associated translation inhibitor RaiA [Candidatus Hydrogenedentota bacterium]HOJ67307.1 ribosome-associated translation inhibitor RaiA [Candidatus Hydrogenedentota bacterium]HOK90238.1 ribosome-associated translation inhibitor RaiA [Candidatus Hydrogenedentota bacterium]HOV61347.1 ribosome-associated translation inhibitor RaiA [Candidatus Hydrogenedentota bacterium]
MNVTITGRHMELTDALKSYIETGLKKIRTHFDKVIDVEVVLSVEKHRHIAEINLHANGVRIHSREESSDMYASVDAVLDKLTRQVRKYKDRINRHQPLTGRELRMYQHAVIVPEPVNGDQHAEGPSEPQHKVVQREKLPMKPMTLEEAILQFELVEEPFLVFTNAETSQVNVLYARGDGSYGLIEPEF